MYDIRAFVFDLDGTLLDTLPDLVVLTNTVLRRRGFPEHTRDEILSYVGNGAASLISQAVPPDTPSAQVDEALAEWKANYATLGHKMTKPYPGMTDTLEHLQAQGCKLAVLSNKFDEATRQVIGKHFPGVFDAVHGECADFPRKPDPTGLLRTIDELACAPDTVVYVGDSAGDMRVAHNAQVFSIGVTWGYQSRSDLCAAAADVLIDAPCELLQFLPDAEPTRASTML